MNVQRYLSGFMRAPEDGGGAGGGAGNGAAGAGGAGAGAGSGGAGGAAQPYYSSFGLDQGEVDFLAGKGFTDLKTQLKSHMEADRMVRDRNVIGKPDPKNLAAWDGYEALGWNADRKAYNVAKPEKAGAAFDETEFSRFVDVAHKHKLPPHMAQAIYADMTAFGDQAMADLQAKSDAEMKAADDGLKQKWGTDYNAKRELAKRAMTQFGGHLKVEQIESAMGVPGLVELLANLGAAMGEDAFQGGSGGGGMGDMSAQQARSERLKLEGDPEWIKVFNNNRDPRHKDYQAQRQRLLDIEARSAA